MTVAELISKLQTMPQDAKVVGYSNCEECDISFNKVVSTNLEDYLNNYYCKGDSEIAYDYKNRQWVYEEKEDENGYYIKTLSADVENCNVVVLK